MLKKVVQTLKRCSSQSSIHIIMITRLFFGCFFEFTNNKYALIVGRIYALCWCATVYLTFTLYYNIEYSTSFILSTVLYHIEHYAHILACIISGQKYFFDFYKDMQALNADLPEIRHESPISMVIFIATLTFDIINALVFDSRRVLMRNVIIAATNMCYMSNIILFELMYCRLKILREALKKKLQSSCLAIQNSEGDKSDIINNYMQIHKKIATSAEKGTNNIFFITTTLLTFVAKFCRALIISYQLVFFKALHNDSLLLVYLARIITIIIIPFAPGFLAQGVNNEMNEIKLLLGKELLICEDGKLREVIEDSLKYLELRPMKVSILRVSTLDTALFLKFISLTTFYIIVMLQFTHMLS